MTMNRMKATGAAAALMLAVGTLGGVSTTATAAPAEPAPASPTGQADQGQSRQASQRPSGGTAYVQANNVIFRDAPHGKALGQVHLYQGGWAHCVAQVGWDDSWVKVDLWGGPSNVWIHRDYVGLEGPVYDC